MFLLMNFDQYDEAVDSILERFRDGLDFRSMEVDVPKQSLNQWICMRRNPSHFSESMFLGVWSVSNKHPKPGSLRIVRLMEMPDDTVRLIARQGENLFVNIFEFENSQDEDN